MKTKPFDAASYLKSEEEVVEYLIAASDGGDRSHIEGAVRDAVRALKVMAGR
jgi:DNA-binding phage protein